MNKTRALRIITHGIAIFWVSGCERRQTVEKGDEPINDRNRPTRRVEADPAMVGRLAKELRSSNLKSDFDERLNQLSAEQIADLISNLDPSDPAVQIGMLTRVLRSLAKRDPSATLDIMETFPVNLSRVVSNMLSRTLVAADSNAVGDWIIGSDWKDEGVRRISYELIEDLAKLNPEASLALLRARDPKMQRDLSVIVIREIAGADFPKALSAARGLADAGVRNASIAEAIKGYSGIDPAEAYQVLREMNSEEIATKSYDFVFSHWIDRDPEAALEQLLKIPPNAISRILAGQNGAGESYVSVLYAMDPDRATQAMNQLVFTKSSYPLFVQAAAAYAKRDVGAALDWVAGFPEGPARDSLLKESTYSHVAVDPSSNAPQLLARLGPGQSAVLEGAGRAWGEADPSAAGNYSTRLEPKLRGIFLASVLNGASNGDPRSAAGLISQFKDDQGIARDGAFQESVRSTATRFSSEALPQAIAWADSLDGPDRASASAGIVEYWMKQDADAAGEWAGALPDGDVRDAAIRAVVEEIQETDPAAAVEWRATLSSGAP